MLTHSTAITARVTCITMSSTTPSRPLSWPFHPTFGSSQGPSMLRRRVRVKLFTEKNNSARLRPDAVLTSALPSGLENNSVTVSAVTPVSPSRVLRAVASARPSLCESQLELMMSSGMTARNDCPAMPKTRSRTSTASSWRTMRKVVPGTGLRSAQATSGASRAAVRAAAVLGAAVSAVGPVSEGRSVDGCGFGFGVFTTG